MYNYAYKHIDRSGRLQKKRLMVASLRCNVLVSLGCYKKTTIDWVANKEQKCLSHSSVGSEVQDEGANRFSVWRGQKGRRELSRASFTRALILFVRTMNTYELWGWGWVGGGTQTSNLQQIYMPFKIYN